MLSASISHNVRNRFALELPYLLYFQKMFMNKYQIHTLKKLRDMLLPKLMSGEVRVGN